jgi:hypothetical protein
MMNKSVCKRCINDVFKAKWTLKDESLWERGLVCCEIGSFAVRSIKLKPPEECPYLLEHLVNKPC